PRPTVSVPNVVFEAAVIEKPLAQSAGRKLLDLPAWDAPKASSLRTRIARHAFGYRATNRLHTGGYGSLYIREGASGGRWPWAACADRCLRILNTRRVFP